MKFETLYLKMLTRFERTELTDNQINLLTDLDSNNPDLRFQRIANLMNPELELSEEIKNIILELRTKSSPILDMLHWLYFNGAFYAKPLKRFKEYHLSRFSNLKEKPNDEDFDRIFIENASIDNIYDLLHTLLYNDDKPKESNDRKYIQYIMHTLYLNYNQIAILYFNKDYNSITPFLEMVIEPISTVYWFGTYINFKKIKEQIEQIPEEIKQKYNFFEYKFETNKKVHVLAFKSKEEEIEE